MSPAFVFYGPPERTVYIFMNPAFDTGGHRLLRRTLVRSE
jgi:hypothetical protein